MCSLCYLCALFAIFLVFFHHPVIAMTLHFFAPLPSNKFSLCLHGSRNFKFWKEKIYKYQVCRKFRSLHTSTKTHFIDPWDFEATFKSIISHSTNKTAKTLLQSLEDRLDLLLQLLHINDALFKSLNHTRSRGTLCFKLDLVLLEIPASMSWLLSSIPSISTTKEPIWVLSSFSPIALTIMALCLAIMLFCSATVLIVFII